MLKMHFSINVQRLQGSRVTEGRWVSNEASSMDDLRVRGGG